LIRYVNELKEKIELKLIPNKTNEQILKEYFKYFDLESLGLCNLQNFIKTNERLGLVYKKSTDLEKIFNYFDKDKKGIINYKDFIKEIFNIKKYNENSNTYIENKDFVNFLNNHLLEKGGNLQLINLIKALQIIDYNDSMRMSIDDFLKVINESHLDLKIEEIQYLFKEYEYFSNGVVYYKKIIDKLINQFYNKKRDIFAENLYDNLTNNEYEKITLNDIENININY
jgi:Ca2+-binding EF-hand superfamily protein